MLRLAHTATELERDDTEDSVTVAEAARRLGCDESTVRALAASGRLRGHRVGKTSSPRGVRIDAGSIKAYKMANAITPTEAPAAEPMRHARPTHRQALAKLRGLGVV